MTTMTTMTTTTTMKEDDNKGGTATFRTWKRRRRGTSILGLRLAIYPITRRGVLKLILSLQLPFSHHRQGPHSSLSPRPPTRWVPPCPWQLSALLHLVVRCLDNSGWFVEESYVLSTYIDVSAVSLINVMRRKKGFQDIKNEHSGMILQPFDNHPVVQYEFVWDSCFSPSFHFFGIWYF